MISATVVSAFMLGGIAGSESENIDLACKSLKSLGVFLQDCSSSGKVSYEVRVGNWGRYQPWQETELRFADKQSRDDFARLLLDARVNRLSLKGSFIDDQWARCLAGNKCLEQIWIVKSDLTNLSVFVNCKNLKWIKLMQNRKLSPEAINRFKKLRPDVEVIPIGFKLKKKKSEKKKQGARPPGVAMENEVQPAGKQRG